MFVAGLSDLDALYLRCRDVKARAYIAEAVTCLKAGAFRASIVVTWVAVVHDLRAKLEQLSIAGDRNAIARIEQFKKSVAGGDLDASLKFERTILSVAQHEFELFGHLAGVDLERLREDRNRCAHPSMLDADTDYHPAAELARLHVVNAVTHLLQHGPSQGNAAIEELVEELEQKYYPKAIDDLVVHLENGPLGRPRASLVRNFVTVLLKKYFEDQELAPADGPLGFLKARAKLERTLERIRLTLAAVIRMHREIAIVSLNSRLDDIVTKVSDAKMGDLVRLIARIGDAWYAMSQAQKNRVSRYVESMPSEDLVKTIVAAWNVGDLRGYASERIKKLDAIDSIASIDDPPPEWIQLAIDRVSTASTWEAARKQKQFLHAFSHMVSEEQVRTILEAARSREILQSSWAVRDILNAVSRSPNVGPDRMRTLIGDAGLSSVFSIDN